MTNLPQWGVRFSATCPEVTGHGYTCMICPDPATGHATIDGGPHHGRCLAITCPRHGTQPGWADFKARLITWSTAGLLNRDGGPGPAGAPQVRHRDHDDPMPLCPRELS